MLKTLLLIFSVVSTMALACENGNDVRYCDSSTGLNVNQNGDYGSSYCTRHAIMDMQKFEGMCMWHGGVAKITGRQEVICNDGTLSELSTLRNQKYDESLGFVGPNNASKESAVRDQSNYKFTKGSKVVIN